MNSMGKIEIKKDRRLVTWGLENDIRFRQIATGIIRNKDIIPVMKYSCDETRGSHLLTEPVIQTKGIIFESGDLNDLVNVNIRPDVSRSTAKGLLLKIAEMIGSGEDDWMPELQEKIGDLKVIFARLQQFEERRHLVGCSTSLFPDSPQENREQGSAPDCTGDRSTNSITDGTPPFKASV